MGLEGLRVETDNHFFRVPLEQKVANTQPHMTVGEALLNENKHLSPPCLHISQNRILL
jgi:hypothetical protein